MRGSAISLRRVSKSFGATSVLRAVDLELRAGEFLTLLGPSGCGKSTLLRTIAGLERQSAGEIRLDGRPIDHLRPSARQLAMVFQSYALYPHMSVRDNLAMPLVMRRCSFAQRLPGLGRLVPGSGRLRREIAREVEAVARQLSLQALLHRRPAQLSGGQRQRVALGRAMVRSPRAFLMDEPLSNLDARLRVEVRTELAELHRRLEATFLYVTHDQVEAMTMSQRIAVMIEGEIIQIGTPSEVYGDPQNLRVARFIGSPPINVLPARLDANGRLELFGRALPLRGPGPSAATAQVGLRPEDVRVQSLRPGDRGWPARLGHVENLGNEFVLHLDLDAGPRLTARGAARELGPLVEPCGQDSQVSVSWDPERLLLFTADGRRVRTDAQRKGARGSEVAA